MILIDDVIEDLIFGCHDEINDTPGVPAIQYKTLVNKLADRLHQVNVHVHGERHADTYRATSVLAMREVYWYLDRHTYEVDCANGWIIWTHDQQWVPGMGWDSLLAPVFDNLVPVPTSLEREPEPEPERELNPIAPPEAPYPMEKRRPMEETVTIVDGLPSDIDKPSEAWAWWLQQPKQVDFFWTARKIAKEISAISTRFTFHQLDSVRIAMEKVYERHEWSLQFQRTAKHKKYGVAAEDAPFDYRMKNKPLAGRKTPPEYEPDPGTRMDPQAIERPPAATAPVATAPAPVPEVPPVRYKTSDDGESTIAASEFDYVDGMMLRWSYYDGINYFVHRPWPQSLLPYQVFVDQLPAGICDVNSFELYENLAYALFRFDKSHCYRLDDFEMWCIGLCARRSFYKDQPWAVMDVQFEAIRQNLIEMGWQRGPINGSADHYIGPGRLMEANQIADHEGWEETREVQRKVNEEAERLRNLRDDE